MLLCSASATAVADDFFTWTNTELQYLHGGSYREPGNPHDISRSIITFTHSHGWALGYNFMFMDTLISEDGQPSQTSVYGEAYSYLSLSKVLQRDLQWGWFKDFNGAVGVNAGENFSSARSGPRVALYGFSVNLNLPGFQLFSIDFLRHNVLEPSAQKTSWQFTPVWILPFEIAGTKWSLQGFTDFIGSKGPNVASTILSQPQLRLDVGDVFGYQRHFYLGIEYQYWHNKYGIKGLNESLPQALLVWKF